MIFAVSSLDMVQNSIDSLNRALHLIRKLRYVFRLTRGATRLLAHCLEFLAATVTAVSFEPTRLHRYSGTAAEHILYYL